MTPAASERPTVDTVIHLAKGPGEPGAIPIRLRTVRRAGDWLACAEIQTPDGPLRFTGTASEATVSKLMQRAGMQPPAAAAGFDFFKDIGNTIAKVAQSSAAKQALAGVQSVVKNPLLMAAASAIPGVGPAIATVATAANAATAAQNILSRARRGDATARAGVHRIQQAARSNPRAAKMLNVLHAVARAPAPAPAPAPLPAPEAPAQYPMPGLDPYSLWMQQEAQDLLAASDGSSFVAGLDPGVDWSLPVAAGAVAAAAPFGLRQPSPQLIAGLRDLMARARALPQA